MATQQLSQLALSPASRAADSAPSFRPHLVKVGASTEAADRRTPDLDFRAGEELLLSWEGVPVLRDPEQPAPLIATPGDLAHPDPARPFREIVKRTVDVLGAIALGLIFLPLMLAIVLLLRNDGCGVIYRHWRIGRNGKMFECFKFRSMVPDAERRLRELLEQRPELKAEWLRDHKLRNDPRITALGRFLRRTSLDELPQIWNVIRGDMSLVGPRPVVREELLRYGRSSSVYLSARPGITGLWQVTGRNDTDYRRRVVLDVYYVRKQCLLLDIYILLKTTRVVFRGGGAY